MAAVFMAVEGGHGAGGLVGEGGGGASVDGCLGVACACDAPAPSEAEGQPALLKLVDDAYEGALLQGGGGPQVDHQEQGWAAGGQGADGAGGLGTCRCCLPSSMAYGGVGSSGVEGGVY